MRRSKTKAAVAAVLFFSCFTASFPAFAKGAVGTSEIAAEANEYVNAGPGAAPGKEAETDPSGISLGTFTITGYCGCTKCSGGHNLTYSGTVPTPNHTLSADLELYPIGTKLKIDGIVYTVEDKGSSVDGNLVDIYYATHEEALEKGTYKAEVFLVEE